jgi:hypothetical protein
MGAAFDAERLVKPPLIYRIIRQIQAYLEDRHYDEATTFQQMAQLVGPPTPERRPAADFEDHQAPVL